MEIIIINFSNNVKKIFVMFMLMENYKKMKNNTSVHTNAPKKQQEKETKIQFILLYK